MSKIMRDLDSASTHALNPPKRRSYRAARAFYLVIAIGILLAAYAAVSQHDEAPSVQGAHLLRRSEPQPALNDEEECRLVHRTRDQCSYIKKHCPDDEPGFSAYLDLYFCQLPHVKAIAFIILISWLGILFSTIGIAASDFFCINLSTIASILGMSESMAGVTLLAFGNGSPDVFSTFAAMSTNSGSLAVGELMGAAGFITAVVAGSMALIKPFHVARKSFVRDVGFFIVAAAFSLVFLWDGRLHLWECIVMVLYYFFYVAFVVAWHWWIGRRRRKREAMAAARGHFLPPGDEMDVEEEYHDDPEERNSRPTLSRGASTEDFAALERGAGTPREEELNEDEEEEARDRWMSELNSNMRLSRATARTRRNTITPVRPSLVGALEFQAVLNSLQKSRNIQTIPMNSRRFSDDPTYTTAQQQEGLSSPSDPAARPPFNLTVDTGAAPAVEGPRLDVPKSAPVRSRAVSANDASSLRIDPDLRRPSQEIQRPNSLHVGDLPHAGQDKSPMLGVPAPKAHSNPQTPVVEVSQPSPPEDEPTSTAKLAQGHRSPDLLSASDAESTHKQRRDYFQPKPISRKGTDSPHDSPRMVPQARQLPKITIPRDRRSVESSPATTPFPAYRDDPNATSRPGSIYLPPPLASPESIPASQSAELAFPSRPTWWWPYKILPPPGVMISTLFPTIYHWHEKSIWEKMLGVVAAPSVFLLTITLPVVESDKDGDESDDPPQPTSYDSARSRGMDGVLDENSGTLKSAASPVFTPGTHQHHSSFTAGANSASLAAHTEQQNRHNFGSQANIPSIALEQQNLVSSPSMLPNPGPDQSKQNQEPELWNRWLLLIQLFTAPIFCLLAIYSQSPAELGSHWLLMPSLVCLLSSTVLLIPILLTTTPTHRPPFYRTLLSLAGFLVSIAWISAIAAQVVGALKALAVICNMSHAIMGLTIFAVGNSLGDLVADVTVAKLGYPVMALSACFGGPMLNILLGIGLSGTYILVRGAEHRQHKHPDQGLRFKAYHIDVGRTLIVSGITLLVTLVGLLVAVPLNKWVLSKRIGWALICLWTVSTIGNVVLEVTGWGHVGSEG